MIINIYIGLHKSTLTHLFIHLIINYNDEIVYQKLKIEDRIGK